MTMWSSMAEGAEMEAAPLSSIRDQNQVHAHSTCTRLPASPHHQTRAELILPSSEPVILTGAKDTNLLLGELDAADYA